MDLDQKLQQVCRWFRIYDEYLGYETIQVGNVNCTYRVTVRRPDGSLKSYLIQNVNTYAFRNPVGLMENIDHVTEHIRAKCPEKKALHFHHTEDRKTYVIDGDNFWRMSNYIDSVTYGAVKDLSIVRNAGIAFGEFQEELSDFNISILHETIPGFHNTRKRFRDLEESVAADPVKRVSEVQAELKQLESMKELACTLTDLQYRGELPLRVTHNDTKINNVLFERDTGNPVVVIDLDTVMPGLMGHDFGDAIRFAANKAEEDCAAPEKAGVDLNVFRAFAEGFLKKTAKTMTRMEMETLAISSYCLTTELASRFLDDYIKGDPYFKIRSPKHNLERTRCQLALAKDMLHQMPQMEKIIRECAAN